MEISAVVLAGGKSSRMGKDKALLEFKGKSSLALFQYSKLQKLFKKVYISTKEDKFDFKANLIYDELPISSPLSALASICKNIDSNAFFLIAVDMPFVSQNTIKKLISAYQKEPNFSAYIAKSPNGLEPTVAIYKKDILKTLNKFIAKNEFKLKLLLKELNIKEIEINNIDEFFNINYYKDYKLSLKK